MLIKIGLQHCRNCGGIHVIFACSVSSLYASTTLVEHLVPRTTTSRRLSQCVTELHLPRRGFFSISAEYLQRAQTLRSFISDELCKKSVEIVVRGELLHSPDSTESFIPPRQRDQNTTTTATGINPERTLFQILCASFFLRLYSLLICTRVLG